MVSLCNNPSCPETSSVDQAGHIFFNIMFHLCWYENLMFYYLVVNIKILRYIMYYLLSVFILLFDNFLHPPSCSSSTALSTPSAPYRSLPIFTTCCFVSDVPSITLAVCMNECGTIWWRLVDWSVVTHLKILAPPQVDKLSLQYFYREI